MMFDSLRNNQGYVEMSDYISSAIPSIISGVALFVIGGLCSWILSTYNQLKSEHQSVNDMKKSFDSFCVEHKTMVLAMKNINRSVIVDICNRALRDGYISDVSYRCLCELEETYHMMHGNSYTDELIEKVKDLYKNQMHFPSVLATKSSAINKERI